jgi:uncharacterized Tic20 family protein
MDEKNNVKDKEEKKEDSALSPEENKEQNMWAMFCHLSIFIGFVIPFGNVIAPLIIWLIKKDEFPLVDDQGKEVLNFQISVTIYFIASIILIFILVGIPLLIALGVFVLITTVIGAIKANEGIKYRYPLTIKFLN